MSDEGGGGAWFRPRPYRAGYTPVTWQGWATLLVFVIVLLATILLGDPSTAKPSGVASLLKLKAMFGLSGTHLPLPAMLGLMAVEIAGFLIFCQLKSRPLRALD